MDAVQLLANAVVLLGIAAVGGALYGFYASWKVPTRTHIKRADLVLAATEQEMITRPPAPSGSALRPRERQLVGALTRAAASAAVGGGLFAGYASLAGAPLLVVARMELGLLVLVLLVLCLQIYKWQPRREQRVVTGFAMASLLAIAPAARVPYETLRLHSTPTAQIYDAGARAIAHKKYAWGEANFREVIRRQPSNVEAHSNLGTCLLAQYRFEEAIPEFTMAVRHGWANFDVFYNLGLCHEGLEPPQREDAIADFQKALETATNDRDRIRAAGRLKALGMVTTPGHGATPEHSI